MIMKIRLTESRQQSGNILVMTIITTALIGFVLAAFLTLAGAQNRSTYRSQNWNSSIPVLEAGVEEALAHLNRNCLSNGVNSGVINWTADGWQSNYVVGGWMVMKTNSMPDGTYYVVRIYNTNGNQPDIYSDGYVPTPVNLVSAPNSIFAAIAVNGGTQYQYRKVHVTAGLDGFFGKGMVAKGNINWVGNIWSDSFDSQDPSHSTRGQYDFSNHKDNGSVASVNGNVSMGSGVIYGGVSTGPSGTATDGTVGDSAWITGGNTGIESGHYANDMNVSFPKVQAPFLGGYMTPGPGTANYTNFVFGPGLLTTEYYPTPTPAGGVVTNRVSTITSFTYPNPVPFSGVVTNGVTVIVTNLPSPVPAGLVTNIVTITQTNVPSPTPAGGYTINTTAAYTTNFPAAGTYTGAISTNIVTSGHQENRGTWYSYNRIVSYTYTVVSYQFPSATYTYAGVNYTWTGIVTNMVVTTASYAYVLGTGKYQLSSLQLAGSDPSQSTMLITGNATLYITGDMQMTGNSQIIIDPNATLKLYIGGNARLAGNGIMNTGGTALNFQMYGLETCTDIDFGGNAAFTGIIYAPQATFHAGGGGTDQYDCVGSVIVNEVNMNGHFTFHYDEMLGRNGPSRGYLITSWNEL
jgi:hypothetical protein